MYIFQIDLNHCDCFDKYFVTLTWKTFRLKTGNYLFLDKYKLFHMPSFFVTNCEQFRVIIFLTHVKF